MSNNVKHTREGFHSVTPYLSVGDAAAALEFYKTAFGATELMRMPVPDGRIAHAEVLIGDSIVMLADEFPEMDFRSPRTLGGSAVTLHLYVEDVDETARRAVEAGAKVVREVADQFYGDRSGSLEDPFGHVWFVATHKEDLTMEQVEERHAATADAS